jgi:carboxylesterase type B
MVWIYGGGFYSGTTTLNVYDGKIMAALNNVIVVSIGYRVGAFGFLSLGHASAPGNAGMFDQLMALEWVQQNIRHFGGDPDNVTLFGESAGSVSVSLHLLSPLSHSKFQRAILQSGVALMPWATLTAREARRRSLELAFQYLRCPETDDMEAVADCLRRVTPQQLAEEQFVTRGPLQFPFLPVVDGVFLREHPEQLIRKRAFKKCPLLIGSNANEGSWFIIYELSDFLNLTQMSMTREQFQKSVDKLFYYYPQYPETISPFVLDAIRFQYTNWEDEDSVRDNVRMLEAAVGDSQFICPLNQWAKAYSEAGEKVYSYFFTQVTEINFS